MSDFSLNSMSAVAVEDDAALITQKLPRQLRAKKSLSVSQHLFESAPDFDFFQAVSLLEACVPGKKPVGVDSLPSMEAIRFRVLPTNSFPASAIHEIDPPGVESDQAVMTVMFFGLVGLNGALPRHYTDALLRGLREGKGPEKRALLDWLDIFHHRLISLFHRAWAKYRFPIAYARREYLQDEPDTFTQAMFSLVGMGMPTLRQRLNVRKGARSSELFDGNEKNTIEDLIYRAGRSDCSTNTGERLAEISDLALLRYAGLLTQRPRCVANLQRLIADFFRLPVEVRQFQGQWLDLNTRSQIRLGMAGSASALGQDAVVGARVWSVESKIRLRLGPLSYQQFTELLPDASPTPHRKAFFLLNQLIRLFLGPEIDFDVQLILHADDVPSTQLAPAEDQGPRLGWNCWLLGEEAKQNADDAVFTESLVPCQEHSIAV